MLRSISGKTAHGIRSYVIFDSSFGQAAYEFSSKESLLPSLRCILPELAVVRIYESKKLPVANNLARLYFYYEKTDRSYFTEESIFAYGKLIDSHYPDIQYNKKYFECLKRQMKQLSFGRKYE